MPDPQWWPVDTVIITNGFGADPEWYWEKVRQKGHNAIDLVGPFRTPIYATDDGVVLMEGENIPWSGVAGGKAVIIRHSWGHSGYAHLDQIVVDAGQIVHRGQLIGYMGATGLVLGVHLHFETLPLAPNFANGYSGRVNPHALINLQPRGTGSASTPAGQEEDEEMARENKALYYSEGGQAVVVIGNQDTGWKFKYSTASRALNNQMAAIFQTGDFNATDKAMVGVWERSLDQKRQGK